jgi:hypothetical protein
MAKRALHRGWSDEDTERLRAHIARGGSLARATVMFGRTEQALRAQAAVVGLKFLTINELRRRAKGSAEGSVKGSAPQLGAGRAHSQPGVRAPACRTEPVSVEEG